MNYLCLLSPLSGIFASVAIGVMAPLIGYGWPKGNPLKARYASAGLKTNMLEKSLKAMQR